MWGSICCEMLELPSLWELWIHSDQLQVACGSCILHNFDLISILENFTYTYNFPFVL
uniref:Uncharacterized protein n=1 Tax=Kalanchoe fedtschenkoi TaxID=63787 RepID=A0A7N1A4N4_KALFE